MQNATSESGISRNLSRFLSLLLITLGVMMAIPTGASAQTQMCGSYTIGGTSPNYATIEAAITDLTNRGVSCAVTFLIRSGTYTPPATSYNLVPVAGMSSTNTVTFRPDASATVTLTGTTNNGTGVFTIDAGDYYVIDGANTAGGTSRNMTIIQGNTSYGAAIMIKNDADYNVVKNTIMMSNHGSVALDLALGGVTLFIVPNTAPAPGANGNDSTLIQNNQVGDINGVYRSHRAVYTYGGSAAAPNIGTKIIGNDVVNFGNTQGNAMGIFISYFNNGSIVRGNTVRMTSAPTGVTAAYGIYVNESLGNGFGQTIDGNMVYGLRTAPTTGSEAIYGIFVATNSNNNSSNFKVINNMITHDRGSTTATLYGMYFTLAPSNIALTLAYNSVYLAGSAGTAYGTFIYMDGTSTINHRNNAYHSTFTSTTYMVYVYTSTTGWTSTNNLYEFPQTTGQYISYFGTLAYANLASWQAAGSDASSVTGNPRFIDPASGNLHISTTLPTPVESRGVPVTGVTTDFDGNTRSTTLPDIGADEGNFNGGGIVLTSPNGGEVYLAATSMPIRFSINRAMTVSIQWSLDDGATFASLGSFALTAGNWQANFTTPDTVTTRARFRIVNVANPIEGDTSNASFTLVRPTVRVIVPNGGERYYEGQSVTIQWSSVDVPSDKRVMLEFSSNGGTSWSVIPGATSLVSANSPAVNSFTWAVPVVRTDLGRIRVSITDRQVVNDMSDGNFQILKTMNLLSPNGGEQWFVGDRKMIKWAVINANYLLIEYSTNNGGTWNEVSYAVPSYMDSLEWIVPNTPTTQALVRITNRERPEAQAQSATTFTILRSDLAITSPNGGEQYDLNDPVTVTWTSANTNTLRLEYSSDNGSNWTVINGAIPASLGTYTFTPPAIPTKGGLVRLVNVERERVWDVSDRPFEIMQEPSITIFAPVTGDRFVRGTKANISWETNRIANVDIYYSSNGGANWTLVAQNVKSALGIYSWTVPNQTTTQGKIRIQQTGGQIMAESGLFSIVDPGNPTLRVTTPNGGETYNMGDLITIRWSSTDLSLVSVYYSRDGGATWRLIAGNIASINGIFQWTAPDTAGTNYRIKVESTNPPISDASDASFTINRRLVPSLEVLYPNGGERFAIDSVVTIQWTATDIPGNVNIAYSVDSGATYRNIDIAAASAQQYTWTVPGDTLSDDVLIKVSDDIGTQDVSDAVFEIYRPVIAAIRVLSPNTATDKWVEGDTVDITWSSTGVDLVQIEYSYDGGVQWTKIAEALPSLDATVNLYRWTVTHIADDSIGSVVVRITRNGQVQPTDNSDAPFSFVPKPTSGVRTVETGARVMTLVGNFPNPFTGSTEIRWKQRASGSVALRVYDNSGRVVREADLGVRVPGDQQTILTVDGLSTGTYHYELVSLGGSVRGTMTVVR